MTTQPEQILENQLIAQLTSSGYHSVRIKDESDLLANLKSQLEIHNQVILTESEFRQILNYINKGNVFARAKILRDRVPYQTESGETKTIELINQIHWCKNQFQVTNQVSMEGSYKNRYDVTILINGLPLVQIELKKRGIELKQAFHQIQRYNKQSYWAGHGLFQFVQLFVISNGVNTKYYANSSIRQKDYKQTFYWANKDNTRISNLTKFADTFLERCHLSKMITKYIVLNESEKLLMVLRPYQYYATEAIVDRVKSTTKFGYIWHTTGSGKTLTSFKTAQILTQLPNVDKVLFVVDRKDLDYQTTKEFNSFSKGSIDGTNNTNTLVKQLSGNDRLIVTTIQKLNTAIGKQRYVEQMADMRDQRIVFIFDECHRSQFGKTHAQIKAFFPNCQMFGFTGTPIFAENAGSNEFGKRTTANLFNECLHKYVITDAIRDENVLKFSVEYIRTFKKKNQDVADIEIEDIDRAEVMDAPERLSNVVDYIISNHDRKTHQRKLTAIFCVSSIPTLIQYANILQAKKESGQHDLKWATIFSYGQNVELLDDEEFENDWEEGEFGIARDSGYPYGSQKHPREYLESFIEIYNKDHGTNYSTRDSQSFYNYYNDIAKKVKSQSVDILLVVNMFLTGFDSKSLNTLYVDKNLKYHGLIQAYSRTNRIFGELKSQGNIVCFRNLKDATDKAIALFSNKDAQEEIIIKPYEEYVEAFSKAHIELMKITPTVPSVDKLEDEEKEAEFIKAFRELIRLKNVLKTFTEFTHEDLSMDAQMFEDFKSKYLDIYEKAKNLDEVEKVSILNEIDFELELIHRDEINVAYILKLLAKLKDSTGEQHERERKAIVELVVGQSQLRSKRELIEKFIEENLPLIDDPDTIPDEFEEFWNEERVKALHNLSKVENLESDKLEKVIGDYLFTEKKPLRDDVIGMMKERPKLKERASTAKRITQKVIDFVETFVSGLGE